MKSFVQIAIPHKDILEGKFTEDVYAADLWQVVKGKAPLEYQDPDVFFRKTYETKGLKHILEVSRARLEGRGGDSVIQLQTPFGGGKTHSLIALYHKSREWGVNVVVIDGTSLEVKENTPWGEIERQLTGKIEFAKGYIPPGKEKLMDLFSAHQPVLILIDEILQYATRAAGEKVGDSNLASQTLAFLQALTGAVSAVERALLVLTLPSSIMEHYDENAERLYQRLQKITGRIERIYTPVEEDEIHAVIRKRLFQSVEEKEAKKIVDGFVEFAQKEGLLSGEEGRIYRERFLQSYPFKPEVIDILYQRWGSFVKFQRTRGVLRLLSLVVFDLIDSPLPFIRLGDFNLKNHEIRRELIKHIGPEYDSIIAQDITSDTSGARKVDEMMGTSYKPYKLGTALATTIFMWSFSGGPERGGSIKEAKLYTSTGDFPPSIIDTAWNKLKENLFYLSDEGYYFTNQPNINLIMITKEDSIDENEITEYEKEMLHKYLSPRSSKFAIYIWPRSDRDIPDTKDLKLVILRSGKPDKTFLEKHGETPRVYRNTLFFLCIDENQQEKFETFARRILTLESIEKDSSLRLTETQKKEVKSKLKSYQSRVYEELRKLYRRLFIPSRDGFKERDLGVPTIGSECIDHEVYQYLRNEGEILERLSPAVLVEKYLKERDWAEIKKILDAFFTIPGEMRIVSPDVMKECVREGVKNGIFALGYVRGEDVECEFLKEDVSPEFVEGEVIIRPELCVSGPEEEKEKVEERKEMEEAISVSVEKIEEIEEEKEKQTLPGYKKIYLKLNSPPGQIASVVRMINCLRAFFEKCEVKIEILASDGYISISDYENKIEEALRQLGIEIEEGKKEES